MGTASTLSSVFLLAALGASNTNAQLPYQYNPLDITVIGNYQEIKEKYSTSIRDESQLQIIVNISKYFDSELNKFDEYNDTLNKIENKQSTIIEDEEIVAESKFLKEYIQIVQPHYKEQKKPFVL